jgi:HD-GYP domain-containing protein (c-di-GMP phosphodiesterase class II)
VIQRLGVDAAAVLKLEPDDQLLYFVAGQGFRTSGLQEIPLAIGEGRPGRAAQERRLIIAPGPDSACPPSRRSSLLEIEGFISYYGVPLIAKGEVLGVLEVFHRALLQPNSAWFDFLNALAGQAAIALDNAAMFDGLQRSNRKLISAYDATIEGWSRALDLRDRETEGHSQRVTNLTVRVAQDMLLPSREIVNIRYGALLHDIGKMGIPDHILLKPGPLTDAEWVIMRRHPEQAYELLSPIGFLRPALDIPYCHHEKWDGTGYPRRLRAEAIPLTARIFAVVDVWDALRSSRPYRAAWPSEQVRAHVHSLSGTHFDPQVVQAFLQLDGLP